MPLSKEIFDALREIKLEHFGFVFGYHQFPLKEGDNFKINFLEIYPHGKNYLYQWQFLSFGLKNTIVEFLKVMNWVLVNFNFAKCYINDIIVFSLMP
jgi:hypothetical protein